MTEPIEIGPRNDPLGLALRSISNLQIIEESYRVHNKGHVVTQVLQSLVAFIVFPKERKMFDHLKEWELAYIHSDPKWPNLTPSLDRPDKPTNTLYDVLEHMRNAVCHSRITFRGTGREGSDSRDLAQVSVVFEDKRPSRKEVEWRLTLNGANLRKFCDLIVDVVQAD